MVRSRRLRRALRPVLLLLPLCLAAACANLLDIEDLPVGPPDGGAPEDAHSQRDAKAEAGCNAQPPAEITLSGFSVSTSQIDLEFTKGPSYSLKRKVTHAHDTGDDAAWVVLASRLPPCSSAFHDNGEGATGVYGVDGGLTENWQYSYELTVLLPSGEIDTDFPVLSLTIQTWAEPGHPNEDDASFTVSARKDP
jgi:hypothetical protein